MASQPSGPANGLVVVDKAAGWTSHDVVGRLRRTFGLRRVGHAGTLDPDATGVLLVGVGRTTRLLRFLTELEKTYRAQIVLGVATDTLDASGRVLQTWDMDGVPLGVARLAASRLTGVIEQVPPMVSAVKVEGRRLHRLARQGIEVARPARTVTVRRFHLEPGAEPGVLEAEVACSSGTYVRVLAADLGALLGGGAHVRSLRRTAIGSFSETEARPVEEISPADLLPPAAAVRQLETVQVDSELGSLVARGLPLDRVPLGLSGRGPWALLDRDGSLLAVYQATETDRVRPLVVLAGD